MEKTLSLELLTLADYRDAVSEAAKKATAKETKTGIEIQLDLPDIIKKRVAKKVKDIKGIVEDLSKMGFKVDVPSDDIIAQIITRLSSVLSKDSTKDQKTIEIPNVISVKYETKRTGEPE